MLRLYADLAVRALKLSARSWLAAVSIPIYAAIFLLAAALLAPLGGRLAGFLIAMVGIACFAGYLYLLANAVSGSKLRFRDLRQGLRGFWDVCSVSFVLFLISFGVGFLAAGAGPRGPALVGVAQLAMAFFFNPVPELLYNSSNRSVALLKESIDFVMAHAFAWFIPNIVFALILLAPTGPILLGNPGALLTRLASLSSPLGAAAIIGSLPIWAAAPLIVFVHYVMVYRGLLFRELGTGSARMRAFRRRMEG
jgi:hypothetical protein